MKRNNGDAYAVAGKNLNLISPGKNTKTDHGASKTTNHAHPQEKTQKILKLAKKPTIDKEAKEKCGHVPNRFYLR